MKGPLLLLTVLGPAMKELVIVIYFQYFSQSGVT